MSAARPAPVARAADVVAALLGDWRARWARWAGDAPRDPVGPAVWMFWCHDCNVWSDLFEDSGEPLNMAAEHNREIHGGRLVAAAEEVRIDR
jgi:hypothetical protein